jgi:streptogrisin C
VRHSGAELAAIQARLDALAAQGRAGQAESWYVDVVSNAVVVTVRAGAHDPATRAFVAVARQGGDAVRIETSTAKPVSLVGHASARTAPGMSTASEQLLAGEELDFGTNACSTGFNARDQWGYAVFTTSGSCAAQSRVYSRHGTTVGTTWGYYYPGRDFAYGRIDDPTYWNPQPVVDAYAYGQAVVVGYSSAPVGAQVCKSGMTTGWKCGYIRATNVTISVPGGQLYGQVRADACAERGDAGGPWLSGNYAQGMTTAAALYDPSTHQISDYGTVCGEKVGALNISYYQPIGLMLSTFTLTLMTW